MFESSTLSKTVMKEFYYAPCGISVKLIIGFEGDDRVYHAVETKTGMKLPLSNPHANKVSAQVFGPSLMQYTDASAAFRKEVSALL